MKLLVVEDSAQIRNRILSLLRRESRVTVVGVASTNVEAVELFEALRPEVVTLDVTLRDGVSLDTLRRMVAANPAATVIVVTDHTLPLYRDRYLQAGAAHFLGKSDLAQLLEILEAILGTQ